MTGKPEVAHLVTLDPTARRAGSTGGTARGAVDYDAFAVLARDGRIIGLEFELACLVRLLLGGSIGVVPGLPLPLMGVRSGVTIFPLTGVPRFLPAGPRLPGSPAGKQAPAPETEVWSGYALTSSGNRPGVLVRL
jgi:hypothetical protein